MGNIDEGAVYASLKLKESHPSDEILLNSSSYQELIDFRKGIVGEDTGLVSDLIWSGTLPIRDFVLNVGADSRMRFCIFEEALEKLDSAPEGQRIIVGAMQEMGYKSFWPLIVTKGSLAVDITDSNYKEDGTKNQVSGLKRVTDAIEELWITWHAIQLALLHPKTRETFAHPQKVKEYTREKDVTGNRRRVVRYIRRHVIDAGELKHSLKEITRHCQCWYVIGHWRHLSSGKVTYVKGYWKGELREMQRNINKERMREIAV